MAKGAELVIRISGNSKKFRKELDKVRKESRKTAESLTKAFGPKANRNVANLKNSVLKLSKAEQRAAKEADKAARAAKKAAEERERRTERRLRNIKRVAAALAVLAVAGLTASVIEFAKFEQGLAGVSKTTNITGKALKDFGDEITAISIKLGTSSGELLVLAKTAGQLGIQGSKSLLKFTETLAGLAKTTNIVGEEGAIALARLIGLAGELPDNVDRIASAIVDLGNNTKALENEILFTAQQIAGAGKVFGITATQALGLASAFAELAIPPELARGTILRAFGKIQKAISEGGSDMEKLIVLTGLTGEALEKTFAEDATKVFNLFLEGVGKLPQSEIIPFLKSFNLAGLRLEATLPKLALGADLVTEKLKRGARAYKENTALTKELGIQLDTTASRTQQAAEEYKAISRDIGEEFIPATEAALEALRDLVPFIKEDLVPALTFLIGFLSKATGAFKKFSDGIGDIFSNLADNIKRGAEALGVPEGIKAGPIGVALRLKEVKDAEEKNQKELEEILEKGAQAKKDRLEREAVELKESLDTQHETKVEAAVREEVRQAGVDELAKQIREERLQERLDDEQEERDEKLEKEQELFEEDMEILAERLELAVAQVDESAIKEVGVLQQKRIAKAKIDGLEDGNEIKREIALAKAKAAIEQSIFDNSVNLGIELLKATGINSKAIFLVEKAAAIAKSIIATNVAATKALSVPPVPNFPLSASTKIAGGINTATIIATAISGLSGAQAGGVVPGGFGGGDRVPLLLEPGELIVPQNLNPLSPNFDETFGGGLGNQEVTVRIDLSDEASQFITVGQREDSTLGVQR